MLSYILQIFQSIYDFDSSIRIVYGQGDGDIKIKHGNLDFFEQEKSLPEDFIWDEWNKENVPFPFDSENVEDVISSESGKVAINYDIIAASFYFLSSWQEIHSSERDHFGRFPYKESFQFKHNTILIPVVNYYFDILKTAIEIFTGKPIQRKLWSDNSIAVHLTHDIDNIHRGWIEDTNFLLKNGNIAEAIKMLLRRLKGKDDWDNLDDVVNIEKDLGVVSSFYFLAKKGDENADYKIKDVVPYFGQIEAASSEIGIHGSLGAGYNLSLLEKEIQSLNQEISGNRFHFLNYDAEITPQVIESSSLSYDCSAGFAEHVGFRNGFCFPFHPYNFKTGKAYKHLQIPLMIMDTTIKHEKYMGQQAYDISRNQICKLLDEAEKFNGMVSILWHNTYFTDYKFSGWRKKYIDMVKVLKDKGAAFYTGHEITNYFLDH